MDGRNLHRAETCATWVRNTSLVAKLGPLLDRVGGAIMRNAKDSIVLKIWHGAYLACTSGSVDFVEIRVRCNEWTPERARLTQTCALSYLLNGCTSIVTYWRWSKDPCSDRGSEWWMVYIHVCLYYMLRTNRLIRLFSEKGVSLTDWIDTGRWCHRLRLPVRMTIGNGWEVGLSSERRMCAEREKVK